MPELPEVEVTKTALAKAFSNSILKNVTCRRLQLRYPLPQLTELVDQKLISLKRHGKYLLWYFEKQQLIWHLGMSGRWHILPSLQPHTGLQHNHVSLDFDCGFSAHYIDPRRFGFALLTEATTVIQRLGIDPLLQSLDAAWLYQKLSHKQQNIKSALLDQMIIAGLGNIYVQEALFVAGILPNRPSNSLSKNACQRLCRAINVVLNKAIAAGGSSLKDFYQTDGRPGIFHLQHQVYGRQGQTCRQCQQTLHHGVIGGRCTCWCVQCQH